MQAMHGLIILIAVLLIGVYAIADYILPDVICKTIPRTSVQSHLGQYNSQVLGDICSGIAGQK